MDGSLDVSYPVTMSSGSALSSRPRPAPPSSRQPFTDVARIKDAEGLTAVISQRVNTGHITIAFFREFERDGEPARTSFVFERNLDALENLIALTRERIAALKESGGFPHLLPEQREPRR